jgi:Mce-associated membrane protein
VTEGPATAAPSSGGPSDPFVSGQDGATTAPSTLRLLLVPALAGVIALAAVTAIVFAWQLRGVGAEQDAREDALRYASQTAKNLTSISVEDLDADLQQVLDGATGEFASDFAERSDNLREVLTTNAVVSEGEVLSAALARFDGESATALVVVDATVRNTQNPEGGVNTYRMKLELERQGDQWLTSMLEFVG